MSLRASTLGSSIGMDDFPDTCEVPYQEPESYAETEEDFEAYETMSFIPVTSDVMDLVEKYRRLVHKLDHYSRCEARTKLVESLFMEMGMLIGYGFNESSSLERYAEKEEEVKEYVSDVTTPKCTTTCAMM